MCLCDPSAQRLTALLKTASDTITDKVLNPPGIGHGYLAMPALHPSPTPANALAFFKSLPPAPGVDPSLIRGNINAAEKQLNANVLAYFGGGEHGASIDRSVKRMLVRHVVDGSKAQV